MFCALLNDGRPCRLSHAKIFSKAHINILATKPILWVLPIDPQISIVPKHILLQMLSSKTRQILRCMWSFNDNILSHHPQSHHHQHIKTQVGQICKNPQTILTPLALQRTTKIPLSHISPPKYQTRIQWVVLNVYQRGMLTSPGLCAWRDWW